MRPSAVNIQDRVDVLSASLDEQIDLLDLRRRQLAELGEAVVANDNDLLEKLLQEIEDAQGRQAAADRRLREARAAVAEAMGCAASQVRLGELAESLKGPQRTDLERRRSRIIDLSGQLRREHLKAAVLLTECSRVNRMLLACFLPRSQSVTTYTNSGPSRWREGAGLVDTES